MRADIPPSRVLTSWKEIASYLGKGVRTVQRWEFDFRLPVHRPNKKPKGFVYALQDELDRWLATDWAERPKRLQVPQPVKAATADVDTHRELRGEQRELMGELRQTLCVLTDSCRRLAKQTKP